MFVGYSDQVCEIGSCRPVPAEAGLELLPFFYLFYLKFFLSSLFFQRDIFNFPKYHPIDNRFFFIRDEKMAAGKRTAAEANWPNPQMPKIQKTLQHEERKNRLRLMLQMEHERELASQRHLHQQKIEKVLEKQRKQHAKDMQRFTNFLCLYCKSNPRSVVFGNCAHLVCCQSPTCLQNIKPAPSIEEISAKQGEISTTNALTDNHFYCPRCQVPGPRAFIIL